MTNNNVQINIAEFADLETILELQKESYLQEAEIYNDFSIPPLTQDLDSLKREWKDGVVLKAVLNDQIIGSVRARLVDGVCEIGKLIVKPGFQNQGIGKKLMAAIEKQFNNCSVYELFTGNRSEKNLAMYRKSGYKDSKQVHIDSNLTLIYLQKQNGGLA